MASSAGFKQECPSCEALVPIRDPDLIGRKIQCPKCKARFVVEDPDDDEDEEEARPARAAKKGKAGPSGRPGHARTAAAVKKAGRRGRDDDDDDEDEDDEDRPRPRKKKAGGGPGLVLLFVGLGVGALVLVGAVVGGVLYFMNGDSTPSNTRASGPPSGPPAQPAPAQKPAEPTVADVTNLLPNAVDSVLAINVDRLLKSAAGKALFESTGGFKLEGFQKRMGFPFAEVQRVVTGLKNSGKPDGWSFCILHTAKPLQRDDLIKNLALVPDPRSPIEGHDFYRINVDLDTLGRFVLADGRADQPLYCHLYDDQTLIVTSQAQMVEFLTAKRQPKPLTQTEEGEKKSEDTGEAAGGQQGGPGGMRGGPGGLRGGPGGGMQGPGGGQYGPGMQGGGPGGGMQGPGGGQYGPGMQGGMRGGPGGGMYGPQGGTAANAPAKASGSWLTIKPSMKVVLDEIDDPKDPPVLLVAGDPIANPDLVAPPGSAEGMSAMQMIALSASEIDGVGLSVQQLEENRVTAQLGITCKSDTAAKSLETGVQPLVPLLAKAMGDFLKVDVAVLGGTGAGSGSPFPGGGMYGPGMQGGPPGRGPMGGGGQPTPPGGKMGGLPGGAEAPGAAGGPAGPGGPGGAAGPGGAPMSPRPMPGGAGGPTYGPGGAGGPAYGPGGAQPGTTSGEKPSSWVRLQLQGKTVVFAADLALHGAAADKIRQGADHLVVLVKGRADMDGRSHLPELAAGLKSYADKTGHFPRGTVDRPAAVDRAGLPWRPDQRVSWVPEVLPYLGDGTFATVARQVKPDKSWDDEENRLAAETLIPDLLAHDAPQHSWWVRYPGLQLPVGATHFVGVAGVGLDAAEYSASDPAVAGKLGVFGYDRETRLADIKDGPEQTIALLQVPPTYNTCWLAGGGSTVRGVPEVDSVRPFVCAKYNGKRGTFAVMADGKVRFIPETISDKDFQALCTINGGDKVDVDKIAPVVPAEGLKPELKAEAPAAPARTATTAPAAPATAAPAADLKDP
jgi:hypothetical protein